MLRIDDLMVKIQDKEVLKHIDLEINKGETHVLYC
jgi:Fe-S cluster assembly ATPase SufC